MWLSSLLEPGEEISDFHVDPELSKIIVQTQAAKKQ